MLFRSEYKSHVLLNDIVICFYTEHSRLYHPRYQITASNIITDNSDIKSAAEQYYNHLYQEDYSKHVHNLLAREVQFLCKTTKSLLINIPCFEHEHLEKFYGLWYCAPNGLVECSKMDADWDSFHDSRINHFTPKAHEILYNDIKLHIDYYLKNRYDYNFIPLNPQIFA